jgi:hypothetical protein
MSTEDSQMEAGELSVNRKEPALKTEPKVGTKAVHNRKYFICALGTAILLLVCIFTPLYIKNKNNDSAASLSHESDNPTSAEEGAPQQYLSKDGPLGYRIPLFGPDVVEGYENADDLASDIENVARFLVSSTMQRDYMGYSTDDLATGLGTEAPQADLSLVSSSPVGNSATDFEANNQESGIDQGDYIVSDGTNGKLGLS